MKRKVRQAAATVSLVQQFDLVQTAVGRYRPLPYEGKAIFFSAASRPEGLDSDFRFGWKRLVTGGFEAHEIPGNHRSMFSEPNVELLAEKMKLYLKSNRIMRTIQNSRVTMFGIMACVLN